MHPLGSEGKAHPTPGRHRLTELVRVFLKLGVIGFGGPAAHLAMMDDEVVERRKWLSREHFLDLVGATNLILGLPFLTHPPSAGASALAVGAAGAAATVSLWQLGLFFLKVGAVLYGSGYVLVAFLEGGLVEQFGWLTRAELLDAIALGQLTPGPILSTATFVGFLLHAAPGAAVATVGVFLPSFVFVLALNPVIPRLRTSAWMSAFLDAVNVAAIALMLAVTIQMGATVLVSWPAWVIALAAAVVVLRFRVNAAWVVLGGAPVGYPLGLLA